MDNLPTNHFVKAQQFTRTVHRDIYPSIDPTLPSLSQAGKVIVITGASQGLGAQAFVPASAKASPKVIVLVARNAEKLAAVVASVEKTNPKVETLCDPTDISDPASVTALFEKIKSKYGHADVLINNAGVFKAIAPIRDVETDLWWAEQELNLLGTFLTTRAFLRTLPSPSTPASILTLTTGAAYSILPDLSAYSLSKLSALQFSAYVAAENPNVVAISLHPGVLDTEMTIPSFKRFALDTPALMEGVGVWLLSRERAWLSGRFASANWSVDELEERKDEIVRRNLLRMDLVGRFGSEQFEEGSKDGGG